MPIKNKPQMTPPIAKPTTSEQKLLALDIAEGLADIEAGRVSTFDPQDIIRMGEKLLAAQKFRSA
jgi:hypothetical protein